MNIDIIKKFEGFRDRAYTCSAGKATIGYGHTKGVKLGDRCTREQAEKWLEEDAQEARDCILSCVMVNLSENQLDALTSFVFNVGCGSFKNSTLLKLLNKGWYEQVPIQLMRWNKVNREAIGGLTRRRVAEVELWKKG